MQPPNLVGQVTAEELACFCVRPVVGGAGGGGGQQEGKSCRGRQSDAKSPPPPPPPPPLTPSPHFTSLSLVADSLLALHVCRYESGWING